MRPLPWDRPPNVAQRAGYVNQWRLTCQYFGVRTADHRSAVSEPPLMVQPDRCSAATGHRCMLTAQADWAIVERGWHAHVLGEAPHTFTSAVEAVKTLRVRRQGFFLRHMEGQTSGALGLVIMRTCHAS